MSMTHFFNKITESQAVGMPSGRPQSQKRIYYYLQPRRTDFVKTNFTIFFDEIFCHLRSQSTDFVRSSSQTHHVLTSVAVPTS